MKDVGIIGNGKIGKAVASLLRAENFTITVADSNPGVDCVQIDGTDEKQVEHFASNKDAIISTGPYFINKTIAKVCAKSNKAYFDPTEDIEIADYVSECINNQTMMTQCGLAPGAVNIIAANLISKRDEVLLEKKMSSWGSYLPGVDISTDGLDNDGDNLIDSEEDSDEIGSPRESALSISVRRLTEDIVDEITNTW